jgi:hypothetical protein
MDDDHFKSERRRRRRRLMLYLRLFGSGTEGFETPKLKDNR